MESLSVGRCTVRKLEIIGVLAALLAAMLVLFSMAWGDEVPPLIDAAKKHDFKQLQELLEKEGDVNANSGGTALMWASYEGQLDMVRLLLEKGADINFKGNNGGTALMYACVKGDPEIVKLLLENGADVDAKDGSLMTALMWASYEGRPDVLRMLLEKGADINPKNQKGFTALGLASEKSHLKVAELLREQGAK